MLKKTICAVIPAALVCGALVGSVRADELDALVEVASDTSFEVDALAAAFEDDDLAFEDAEVMPMLGSEAMDAEDEIDADVVGYYFRRFRGRYHGRRSFGYRGWGYRGYGYRNYGYRGFGYGPLRPAYRSYRSGFAYRRYCW